MYAPVPGANGKPGANPGSSGMMLAPPPPALRRSSDSALHTRNDIAIATGLRPSGSPKLGRSQDIPVLPCLLGHMDFWPKCHPQTLRACDTEYEDFNLVVERANTWLSKFARFELVNVETVDKKVIYSRDVYSPSLVFTDEDGPILATHLKGLRVWYRERSILSVVSSITLAFQDTLPRYLNPGAKHPKFETLEKTVDKINNELKQNPLPGKILGVETVVLKIAREDWRNDSLPDPCQCRWYDEYNTHQLSFLRIYYAKGTPAYQLIGVQDFTPATLDEGSLLHAAQYSTFSALVGKATAWVHKTSGVRVMNAQTLVTKHRKKSENHGKRFNTGKMFEFRIEQRFRAFYLRLGYVTVWKEGWVEIPVPHLTCVTYIPAKGLVGYEMLTHILDRIQREISDEQRPVHVETVAFPEWIARPEANEKGERTFFDGEWFFVADKNGFEHGPYRHTVIYAIRVYYDGTSTELLPVSGPTSAEGMCCSLM